MTIDQDSSLARHFGDLTDPRIERSRLHDLLDLITISICAVVAGADSWDDIWLRLFEPGQVQPSPVLILWLNK